MRLKVVSVADQVFAALPKTLACASVLIHHGFDYTMKLDWLWQGWISKIWHMMDIVKDLAGHRAGHGTAYTHLMFIDCADVLPLAGPDEVMERYFEFDHPWVYAAEPFIWSEGSFQPEDYPTPDVLYRYLNAGASIGEIGHMRHWLSQWPRPKALPQGDQDWMAARFIENYPNAMMLDTNCDLFQCCCGSKVEPDPFITVSPGKMYNRITDTYPLIIHANGGDDITAPDWRPLWDNFS